MESALCRACAAAVAIGFVLAGCGDDDSSETAAPQPEVPAIENPRDARGVDPCSLLSPVQLTQFGLEGTGRPGLDPAGLPKCDWGGEGGKAVSVTIFTTGAGLETIAANSEPTTSRVRVHGYPALETFTAGGAFCQYDVGQAPDQAMLASMTRGTPDSCTELQAVLGALVAALPVYPG